MAPLGEATIVGPCALPLYVNVVALKLKVVGVVAGRMVNVVEASVLPLGISTTRTDQTPGVPNGNEPVILAIPGPPTEPKVAHVVPLGALC